MKSIFLTLAICVLGYTSFSQTPTNKKVETIVLVYGLMPQHGVRQHHILSLSKQDAGSHLGKYLQIDQNTGSAAIAKFVSPANLTDSNFGSVKIIYLYS